MARACKHCGEELLGNVNRCWKCGHSAFEETPSSEPIEAQIVDDDEIVLADVVYHTLRDPVVPPVNVDHMAAPSGPQGQSIHRHGSPFAIGNAPPFTGRQVRSPQAPAPQYENVAAKGGAVGAVVLGVLAILGSLLTAASAVTGILGLGMGFWGLLSTRRRLAIFGLVLCSIALVMCMGRGVISIQNQIRANNQARSSDLNAP